MKSSPRSLDLPSFIEYIIIDNTFRLTHLASRTVSNCYADLSLNDDVRHVFQELVGIEPITQNILAEQQPHFTLEEVIHYPPHAEASGLYLTLNLQKFDDHHLIIFIEDVTETAVLRQALVQRVNETELLLNALQLSEAYNRQIISSMGDALFTTNASGELKTINAAALNLFGYDESELHDHPLATLLQTPVPALLSPDSLLTKAIVEKYEATCYTKQGTSLIVSFSCSFVHAKDNDLPIFIYIGRDITARKQAEQKINQALAQEKELNDLKSRFIAMTSHEFKNPLSSILMSVELLEEFADHWTLEKRMTHLKRIRQCTTQMNDLLEDILVLGKADTGKLELQPRPLDLGQFCQELTEELQFLAGDRHPITLQIQSPLAPTYALDEKLLRHVLVNLITNAVKYSPQGGEVDFRVAVQGETVCFWVQDQGIGIPESDQPRLFECFHRSHNVRDIKGTGLGLSIVKQAVDLHGGTIAFHSQLDQGTTFEVRLPLNLSPL
jgi:PAS domain S-box-containing protein